MAGDSNIGYAAFDDLVAQHSLDPILPKVDADLSECIVRVALEVRNVPLGIVTATGIRGLSACVRKCTPQSPVSLLEKVGYT